MDAVVVEEESNCVGYIFFIVEVAFGIAEGAADEHGDTVADVAGDDGLGEFGLAEVSECGVDGVAEVDAGVDEGAVEVEDEEAGGGFDGHTTMVAGRGRRRRLWEIDNTFASLREQLR